MTATQAGAADKLIRMANQIALAFRLHPREEAIASVAEHITSFWTPKMRRDIAAQLEVSGAKLDPLARSAIEKLSTK